ncbi:SDR family oxidoreductase [Acetobacterium sp.]|uniref:SDR family NAD(P)-dependent oxidoreductase n=1 Tax=Acetobacterium sp. TaxID=1872094 RepID=UPI000CBFABF7|nr:SDR family NAD(P)-dependent oxidoreductase [Acetobacterium sp.]MDO9493954.1 SDR family NAD(P)-dependent oxidoreductase [Acetobacterium sp.]PKM75243.1 MAG: oxidoreductase [Firmicutes bacterium HGW-Firmicutes-17]
MGKRKYIVITGASSGIGWATAKAFAQRGKNLVLIARRRERLETLKSEILEDYPQLDIQVKSVDLSHLVNVYQVYDELKPYFIEAWINNAGCGNYSGVTEQDLKKIETMLHLNVEALTIFSSLYVRDYFNVDGTQLINVSSAGGYTIVPGAVTYCAAKFYVSSFTEGLSRELKENGAKLQAKVLAPAATQTEFGQVANDVTDYDYDHTFGRYHTSDEMSTFLLDLYDNSATVGSVSRETFTFVLSDPIFPYAGKSSHNQKL